LFRCSCVSQIILTGIFILLYSSRGIDIPNIDCVILYDLPKNIRTYTHRIGRTARAGKIGRSITIVEKERLQMFRSAIKTYRRKKLKPMDVKKQDFSSMLTDYQKALETFSVKEQKKKLKKRK
jgi:superfamily II DNA/RNA helicase